MYDITKARSGNLLRVGLVVLFFGLTGQALAQDASAEINTQFDTLGLELSEILLSVGSVILMGAAAGKLWLGVGSWSFVLTVAGFGAALAAWGGIEAMTGLTGG